MLKLRLNLLLAAGIALTCLPSYADIETESSAISSAPTEAKQPPATPVSLITLANLHTGEADQVNPKTLSQEEGLRYLPKEPIIVELYNTYNNTELSPFEALMATYSDILQANTVATPD
ncbi:hypothetical protein [Neptuniibacter sp. QD37_11]|uniref:hypothetical protein n=1 Tax=Neptuniibacter sp. QD37_11 TaxID=3398209 RepID=UPI0039F4D2D0